MNRLINYPDELVVSTAELLFRPKHGKLFPYCHDVIHCTSCNCFNTKENKTSNCSIEAWCQNNRIHLRSNLEIDWESFADAFLNTFTLQKYPHFYV